MSKKVIRLNESQFNSIISKMVKMSVYEIRGGRLNESLCSDYGFTPNDEIPEECIDYIISNIEDFKKRYRRALNVIDRQRCSLQNADYDLFEEIVDLANEWCEDNGCEEITPETIEEVFG